MRAMQGKSQAIQAGDDIVDGAQHELESPQDFGFGDMRQGLAYGLAEARNYVSVEMGDQAADEVAGI